MNGTLIDLLERRSPSRAIAEDKLGRTDIEKLMHAAQLSASCYNNQSWRFLLLTEEAALEKGRKALSGGNSWAKKAPLLIFGFSDPDLDCRLPDGRDYYLFDLGMAVQLILLQATELDLIARPMAGYSPSTVKREFNIPDEYEVYVAIAVGHKGDIEELDERLRVLSRGDRQRNPLHKNFYYNAY
ncbi:MAG: nitroreductase family protein [Candidatus Krumholzibacteriota bacterium]|nr:nitroreductase family protein [Candidatus Krumholzibacteriota bacterium]